MIGEAILYALVFLGGVTALALVACAASWLADTVAAWLDRRMRGK